MSNITRIKPHYHPTLAERVEDYRILDREIKKLEKTAAKLKTDIIRDMGDSQEVFNDQGHEIATYKGQFATRFDKVAFSIEYPGVYEKFEYKQESRVFRLK